MKGWVLYKPTSIVPDIYENDRFMEVAEDTGVELEIVEPERFDLTVTRDDSQSILKDGAAAALPDFILPRMGSGTTYFALAVIRHLERLGVFSINSSDSIEIAKDKLYTHQILAQNNLPVPKTMLVKFPVDVDRVEQLIGFPVVVKSITGTQGAGVFLSENRSNFEDLMQLIEATNRTANIILQEYVAESRGSDLRVITIGGRAVACMKRSAPDGSFKTNYSVGGAVEEYEITPEIEWLSTQASQVLNLHVAGVDLLFSGDHYKVCEVNSSPGFKGIESCTGINIPQELLHFARIRLGIFKRETTGEVVKFPAA